MAIDFPASPTLNQTFSSGNVNYIWDGTKWTASVTGGIFLDKIEKGNTKAEVVDTGSDGRFVVTTEGTERLRVDASGRLGVGTTNALQRLHVCDSTATNGTIRLGSEASYYGQINYDYSNVNGAPYYTNYSNYHLGGGAGGHRFLVRENNEAVRIDTSGRLLVGTSSESGNALVTVRGSAGSPTGAGLLDLGLGTTRPGSAGSVVGVIRFTSTSNSTGNYHYASIYAETDGTSSSDTDIPGRLVFSTCGDGASSPTERMRIVSTGDVLINKTGANDTTAGFRWSTSNYFSAVRSSGAPGYINRLTDDGVLLEFAQDSATEGSVSVSGTTVSYNGAHLSRWSQLPSGAKRTEILRGSVLSNIDEMCEWGNEDNEQLNRMKVSDVEGDKNVSGVFQAWDDDDDTYTNDFYCAMTGDFIIRIGAGVTVERGDLLMSAGDGTAKPQDDDIIRSKTIAKVTSTNVSCTYDDGSYCVPCVLMAC